MLGSRPCGFEAGGPGVQVARVVVGSVFRLGFRVYLDPKSM